MKIHGVDVVETLRAVADLIEADDRATGTSWKDSVSPEDLAKAIEVVSYNDNWCREGKSVLVPSDPKGFGAAVDVLILFASEALEASK